MKKTKMKTSLWNGKKAYYGKPINLFGDKDKDGVMNVFDCKPHNKRRQDVLMPLSGGSPLNDMHYRQEMARQQNEYKRQLAQYYKGLENQGIDVSSNNIGSSGGVSYVPVAYIPDSSGNWFEANSPQGNAITTALKNSLRPNSGSTYTSGGNTYSGSPNKVSIKTIANVTPNKSTPFVTTTSTRTIAPVTLAPTTSKTTTSSVSGYGIGGAVSNAIKSIFRK
jgi:hypothetical protein